MPKIVKGRKTMTAAKTYKKLMKRLATIDATQLADVSFEISFSDGRVRLKIIVCGFMSYARAYVDDIDVKTLITVRKRILSDLIIAEVNRLRIALEERA